MYLAVCGGYVLVLAVTGLERAHYPSGALLNKALLLVPFAPMLWLDRVRGRLLPKLAATLYAMPLACYVFFLVLFAPLLFGGQQGYRPLAELPGRDSVRAVAYRTPDTRDKIDFLTAAVVRSPVPGLEEREYRDELVEWRGDDAYLFFRGDSVRVPRRYYP